MAENVESHSGRGISTSKKKGVPVTKGEIPMYVRKVMTAKDGNRNATKKEKGIILTYLEEICRFISGDC